MNSNDDGTGKKIIAVFILEIIGRPKEHLVESLEKIIEDINKEKGIKIIEKKINEPIEIKEEKDLYTTFAEVEIESEGMLQIAGLMFKYMPSNVEIVEPETISIKNGLWSEILTELTRRLHKYDEVARILQIQNKKMQDRIQELEGKEKDR